MTIRQAKIMSFLIVIGLVVILIPVSGCDSQKKAGSSSKSSAPQSQRTIPSTSAGSSKSEVALEQAKVEGKPVLLNFHSTRCIPCIQIEENINKVKPEYEGRVAFIVVDVYDQQENNLTTKYSIETIPTTFFIGKDGNIVNNYVGVMTPDQLKQQLDALL